MSKNENISYTRQPAVAGPMGFYPSDPRKLRHLVQTFIDEAQSLVETEPYGLIAPHAGYVYSGPVAGWAYRQVVNLDFETVIVISPSHFQAFPFISVLPGGAYETPLGSVQIDSDLARKLIDAGGALIQASRSGHENTGLGRSEHALEVQLPFLQVALGDFNLIPVVMGRIDWKHCSALAAAIADIYSERKILVVASSDLSHYHSYNEAYALDRDVIDAIEGGDGKEVFDGCLTGSLEACGGAPIAALLESANHCGPNEIRILRHATSGDVPSGMRDQVVGYLAAAVILDTDTRGSEELNTAKEIEPENPDTLDIDLSPDDKKYLLALARNSIAREIGADYPADLKRELFPAVMLQQYALFVTLRKHNKLRGCIGHILPVGRLIEEVGRVGILAALEDPRFPLLEADELRDVEIEITILSPMRKVNSSEEVIPGRHGLLIRQGHYQGLLLPQVATERGWDREEFLRQTCLKAGLNTDAWREKNTEILVFTALHFAESRS